MKKLITFLCFSSALLLSLTSVHAQPAKSGYNYLLPEMKEMQDDEFGNPGMLAVDAGEILFSTAGESGKSCASCHGDEGSKLDIKDIARYPVFNKALKKPVTLRGQILTCQNERIGNPTLEHASPEAI
ncbi:MAG: hypothetical protein ACN4GR_09870, partial [Arenicellales bacterium]